MYIGLLDRRGRRKHPMFAIDLWNCYDAVLNNLPRTQSMDFIKRILTFCTPSILQFANLLMKLKSKSLTELKLNQQLAGTPQPKKKKSTLC
ncbi:hypothetical protein B4U80_07472 [Leptotrombidium deliense]|uniref:Uncharacterized protein n=1 Tax=Leptotrombidium deliense TaxID=299467 RepID=A0A443RV24_9ACAR|nr:hypothetical protein B4U80_07472 [Leptotrombidium deliense]